MSVPGLDQPENFNSCAERLTDGVHAVAAQLCRAGRPAAPSWLLCCVCSQAHTASNHQGADLSLGALKGAALSVQVRDNGAGADDDSLAAFGREVAPGKVGLQESVVPPRVS